MTEAEDQALERLRTQAGEMFLAQHAEKHEQESEKQDLWQHDHEERHTRQMASHAEKHDAEQQAVDAALAGEERRLDAHRQAHDAAHAAHEREHELNATGANERWAAHVRQHDSEYKAVEQAQASMDKRLDAMNEFRNQLRDQAGTFASVTRLESFEKATDQRFDEFRTLIGTEREERRASEGTRRGSTASVAWIVTAISAVGGILAIIIVVANALSAAP